MSKFNLMKVFLLLALSCLSACRTFKDMSQLWTFSPELKEEPFSFPSAFPLPSDSIKVERKTFGDGKLNISFLTKLSTRELHDLYFSQLSNMGLTSMPAYDSVTDRTLGLRFGGWPGKRYLTIYGSDQKYKAPMDFRLVIASLGE